MIIIKINVVITRDDFWQLNKYALWNKNRRTVLSYFIGTPIFMYLLFTMLKLPLYHSIVASLILGSLINVFVYFRMKSRVKRMPSDKPGLLGSHMFELTEDGLNETTIVNDNFYKWNGIQSIEENNQYIFIFLDNILCHIIPKRAFKSEKDASDFYKKANEYFEFKVKERVI